MRKRDVKTSKDRMSFTRARNRTLGSMHFASMIAKNTINSDLVSEDDKKLLKEVLARLTGIIYRWDKQYSSKLFKNKKMEATPDE